LTPEELAEILKAKIKNDEWTSHIEIENSAILQLATLMLKHGVADDYKVVRFYVFGYLIGGLQQKWKNMGLFPIFEEDDKQPDEAKEWEDLEGEDLPEVKE
jgi:hypothetical protein